MRKSICFIFLLLVPYIIFGVNLSQYVHMIQRGQIEEVRAALPKLRQEYPDNAEVLYLAGVVEDEGNKALLIFKDVVSKYPNSTRADDALYQIIQYIYSSGLYHKAIKYSKGLLRRYPESQWINETMSILLCSFRAVQEKDSIDYYYHYYKEKYSDLSFNFEDGKFKPSYILTEEGGSVADSEYQPASTSERTPDRQASDRSGPVYSIQLGAFGNPSNAYLLKNRLSDKGYAVFTQKVGSESQLLAVRVGKFNSHAEAKRFGENFKEHEDLDYIIVKNQ